MINQEICGESICFILFFFSLFLVYFQENLSLSMPENMACLVEVGVALQQDEQETRDSLVLVLTRKRLEYAEPALVAMPFQHYGKTEKPWESHSQKSHTSPSFCEGCYSNRTKDVLRYG